MSQDLLNHIQDPIVWTGLTQVGAAAVLAALVVAIPSTAAAYPIYFTLIRRVGPVRTNLVAYVVPIVAALTGWLLLDEPVTPATAVGFCVVVAGVALLERRVVAAELARLSS